MTLRYIFDFHPGDIFACMADVGYVRGPRVLAPETS